MLKTLLLAAGCHANAMKTCLQRQCWPHNPAQAALCNMVLPGALGEPAPAGATPAGRPTALRHCSHPGMADRRARPASCVQGQRLLRGDVGAQNTVLALGGNGEASCGRRCSVQTILADCPSLNHRQYLHTATGRCRSTRGSMKYCRPGMIHANLSSAKVPTNAQQWFLQAVKAAQN